MSIFSQVFANPQVTQYRACKNIWCIVFFLPSDKNFLQNKKKTFFVLSETKCFENPYPIGNHSLPQYLEGLVHFNKSDQKVI